MEFQEFKQEVRKAAEERGLTEYELYYEETEETQAKVLGEELDLFKTDLGAGVCLRCVVNGRMGVASTEQLSAEAAESLVEAAAENAALLETEGEESLYDGNGSYETIPAYEMTKPSAEDLIHAAKKMQEDLLKEDERIQFSSQSMAVFVRDKIALSNSKGLNLESETAFTELMSMAIVKNGDRKYNAYVSKAVNLAEADVTETAKKTAEKALAAMGEESVDSGIYTAVFSSGAMQNLLATFRSLFCADSVQRGISLYGDKVGKTVAADIVTLTDDPFCTETYVRMPFDSEGVPTAKKHIIENGKLEGFLHNLATAKKAGIASTGNGRKAGYASAVGIAPYNLYIEKGGAGTKEEIFAAVGSGIYITGLNGLHAGANPATGDFSISSEGFVIEDGKMGRPARNFTISGNFYQLLQQISAIGDDLEFSVSATTCYGSPTLVVKDIAVAGK